MTSSREELAALKLLDALDVDDRPSFAIDAQSTPHSDADAPLDLVYCNAAFATTDRLLAKVTGDEDAASLFVESTAPPAAFRRWVRGVADENDPARRKKAYLFEGYTWAAFTVEHYKIVSGLHASLLWADVPPGKPCANTIDPRECKAPKNELALGRPPKLPPALPAQESSGNTEASPTSDVSSAQHGHYDLTVPDLPPSIMTDHAKYFRSVDWAQTPLGPMAAWPSELRSVVNLTLNDARPAMFLWGDQVNIVYNEAYVQLLGVLHPCMGKSARHVARSYWHNFQPLIDHINTTGQPLVENDIPLFIDRNGFLEETYWSWQFIPILDCKGHVVGYYHPLFETTKHNLLERRVSSLVELDSHTAKARTLQSYWDLALHTLTLNNKDVPFALLYSIENQYSSDAGSMSFPGSTPSLEEYLLKGSIGVNADHAIAPASINVVQGSYVFQPYLTQVVKSRKATIVHLEELGLTTELDGIDWKGFGEPCRVVVICPLLPTTGEQVEGFLILGTNPRRPFDKDYQQFVHVMLRLLSTSLASVILFDDEVRQKEKAIGQATKLQEQLLAEIQKKEKKFQTFAERSDVAIFIMDALGKYIYRNQRWYDLFNVTVEDSDFMEAWLNLAFAEDIPMCENYFSKLVMQKEAVSFELKTKMAWLPPPELSQPECDAVEHFQWILCSAHPELGSDGELVEIVGNVTDISKQKWAEGIQKVRSDNALESKKHLEHFIDTTSHEMRNPLSAILQCADGIVSSYFPEDSTPPSPHAWSSFLESTLDAAQTIAQCAQHMRHIVDDILTVSKLDSGLLVITPVDAQPESIARHALKMFDAEATAARVELSFKVDQSCRDMEVDWVSLDPIRLLQILINLLTNAIKFTRLEATRRVSVVLAASVTAPKSVPGGIQFNEEKLVNNDHHLENDWERDPDLIFLQFSVTDTGRGLSEEERGSLFNRFSQASPRTHIHYGGSGLGLFISRRLTELQGGSIGLASEYKRGSTFSFYIKARQVKPAMVRRGSLPNILPEDIKHRPQTPLLHLSQSPALLRIPSHRTDDGHRSQPPSPRNFRQPTLQWQPSLTYGNTSPEVFRRPLTPGLKEVVQSQTVAKTMHVLVVEDNLINQRVLAKQLRNMGCVVSLANHGREALDFLERTTHWNHNHPSSYPASRCPLYHIPSTEPLSSFHSENNDIPIELSVILMDWEMPIMNGLTAVAKIREMESSGRLIGRVPVIGVTANVRQQQIQSAMKAGMDDVVGKPFTVAELLVRIRAIVAGVTNGVENEDTTRKMKGVENKGW